VSSEGSAIVAFTTGVIAATLAKGDSPLRCDVYTPELRNEVATMKVVTAGGIKLNITVEELD
jgi:hypothetical protein